MPDFDRETSRTAKTHRIEKDGPPRVELVITTDATTGSLRLTVSGATGATEKEAAAELARILMLARNRIRELYGLV